jgi:hypothetical protein
MWCKTDVRGQMTEGRGQKAEDRSQKIEIIKQKDRREEEQKIRR